MNFKDLLLAVLVGYVVIDILLMYAVRARHPGLIGQLANGMQDEGTLVVLIVGIGSGFLAYWLARRSREHFTATPTIRS